MAADQKNNNINNNNDNLPAYVEGDFKFFFNRELNRTDLGAFALINATELKGSFGLLIGCLVNLLLLAVLNVVVIYFMHVDTSIKWSVFGWILAGLAGMGLVADHFRNYSNTHIKKKLGINTQLYHAPSMRRNLTLHPFFYAGMALVVGGLAGVAYQSFGYFPKDKVFEAAIVTIVYYFTVVLFGAFCVFMRNRVEGSNSLKTLGQHADDEE